MSQTAQMKKCNLLKIVSWIFFSSVIIESLYSGFKYNHWLGAISIIIGTILGFGYASYKARRCNRV